MTQLPSIKMKFDYGLLAKILSLVIVIEGAFLAVNAHSVKLEGIGGIREFYIMLAGVQLLVLGSIALIFLVLPARLYEGKKLVSTFINLVPMLVALAIILEALVVAYYSTSITIVDVGHVRSFGMAGVAAQLFFIGAGLLSTRVLVGKENLGLTIITVVALAIGAIGVFVIGIAARTSIADFGGLTESTMSIGGAMLLAASVAMLLLLYLGDRRFLLKEVFGFSLSTLGILAIGAVVSIGGLAIVSYGAEMAIQGIGALPERTMLLFGLALAFLGLAVPATMFSRIRSNKKTGDVAMYAVVFLLLLFPFALFT
ncbi:hypothetical protein [Methanomassiliicoccus luminyensis]|uniref:hypothetical protein n=1 Tax=Methanomassiliicoccus luminyensis TaxID=1080712 RepID=UPI00037DB55F|nr:hypothetical protein [Methanomassiliicoccus luminyensis]